MTRSRFLHGVETPVYPACRKVTLELEGSAPDVERALAAFYTELDLIRQERSTNLDTFMGERPYLAPLPLQGTITFHQEIEP